MALSMLPHNLCRSLRCPPGSSQPLFSVVRFFSLPARSDRLATVRTARAAAVPAVGGLGVVGASPRKDRQRQQEARHRVRRIPTWAMEDRAAVIRRLLARGAISAAVRSAAARLAAAACQPAAQPSEGLPAVEAAAGWPRVVGGVHGSPLLVEARVVRSRPRAAALTSTHARRTASAATDVVSTMCVSVGTRTPRSATACAPT